MINEWESTTIRSSNMDEMYRKVLEKIYKYGLPVEAITDPLSPTNFIQSRKENLDNREDVSSGRKGMESKELLEATCILSNPRARLITNHVRPLNIYFAVGQFLWYMSGSNDAEFIGYYNERAKDFAVNGKIDGNAYGYRFMNVPEGKCQYCSIMDKISADKYTRRAFMSIYQPKDSIENSKETPCPIGVQLIVRENKLNMILKMRSNNAVTLFPFNAFAFTMLQEYSALELNIPIGKFYLNAISLHTLQKDLETSETIFTASPNPELEMKQMVKLKSLEPLFKFERGLRLATINSINSMDLSIDYAKLVLKASEFGEYWRDIAMVLIAYSAFKTKSTIDVGIDTIEPSLAYMIRLQNRRRF